MLARLIKAAVKEKEGG